MSVLINKGQQLSCAETDVGQILMLRSLLQECVFPLVFRGLQVPYEIRSDCCQLFEEERPS
jgi:hypothetical protein